MNSNEPTAMAGAPQPRGNDFSGGRSADPIEGSAPILTPGSCRGRLLSIGWAASVAMWAIAYAAMMRPGFAVSELLVGLMCVVLFAAGVVAARTTHSDGTRGGGLGAGLVAGGVSAAVNLLLVGSLFGRKDNVDFGEAAGWVGTLFGVSLFFAALGGLLGGRQPAFRMRPHWPGVFAFVALCAMFLLLVTGGLVTGLEAGLAVVDWPNTFGHNMLLYPLTEMKEGVYFEHAHRLYGMLVGLTSIVLFVLLCAADRRPWVVAISGLVVAMVVVQGIMGGLRVTGEFTSTMVRGETRPSLSFAIAHGLFAQVTFATLAIVVAATTRSWLFGPPTPDSPAIRRDRAWTMALLAILLVQVFLGVAYRQSRANLPEGETPPAWAFHGHLTMAVVAIAAAIFVGARARAHRVDFPRVAKLGAAILGILGLQVVLGIAALVAVLVWRQTLPPTGVALTTAHQAVGAVLLAHVAMLWAWLSRATASSG